MSVGIEEEIAAVGDVIHINTKRSKPTMVDLARDVEQVEKIGNWIFRSKFFGCDYPEQAMIVASECYLTQTTPLEYLKRNKIIAGKPSFQQYDSMLAGFNERGGTHKIIKNDADGAEIEFTFQGVTETRSLTWEDAKKEAFPYLGKEGEIVKMLAAGKEPELKPKYATPRSRATMLFARLVSASIRSICPSVNFGTYTEEEFDTVDAESVVVHSSVEPEKKAERAKRIAEAVVAPVKPPATPVEKPVETVAVTEEPVKLIASEEGSSQEKIDSPMTELQREEIMSLMAECYAAGQTDIKEKVRKKLVDSGLTKLADMTQSEAVLLITALSTKNVSLWIDSSLAGHKDPS
jgi:hypothetical protein